MSHVVENKARIKESELDLLRRAVAQVPGVEWREGQKTYGWYGRWADDSPVPESMFPPEELARVRAMSRPERQAVMNAILGKCEHAIHVPGSSYEVGVVRRADGSYTLRYDFWGGSGEKLVRALGGRQGEKVMQAYGREWIREQARGLGQYVESEETRADGSIRLRVAAR